MTDKKSPEFSVVADIEAIITSRLPGAMYALMLVDRDMVFGANVPRSYVTRFVAECTDFAVENASKEFVNPVPESWNIAGRVERNDSARGESGSSAAETMKALSHLLRVDGDYARIWRDNIVRCVMGEGISSEVANRIAVRMMELDFMAAKG